MENLQTEEKHKEGTITQQKSLMVLPSRPEVTIGNILDVLALCAYANTFLCV